MHLPVLDKVVALIITHAIYSVTNTAWTISLHLALCARALSGVAWFDLSRRNQSHDPVSWVVTVVLCELVCLAVSCYIPHTDTTHIHTIFSVSLYLCTHTVEAHKSEYQSNVLEHILSCLLKHYWTTFTSYYVCVASDNPSKFLVQGRSFDESSHWQLSKLFLADSLSGCPIVGRQKSIQ